MQGLRIGLDGGEVFSAELSLLLDPVEPPALHAFTPLVGTQQGSYPEHHGVDRVQKRDRNLQTIVVPLLRGVGGEDQAVGEHLHHESPGGQAEPDRAAPGHDHGPAERGVFVKLECLVKIVELVVVESALLVGLDFAEVIE